MIGVAAAVLVLVVRADDGKNVAKGLQRGADLLADEGVRLHEAALLGGERTGLEQDLIGHHHLADVVNHAAAPQSEDLVLGQTDLLGEAGRRSAPRVRNARRCKGPWPQCCRPG